MTLRPLLTDDRLARMYRPFALAITVPVLLLSAVAPSVFLQYQRPFERFADQARIALGTQLEGEAIAECIGLDPWKGPSFFAFYLGARRTDCIDPQARVALIDTRTSAPAPNDTPVFVQFPYALVRRPVPDSR